MSFHKKLALVRELVDNAASSIRSAQNILGELTGKESSNAALEEQLAAIAARTSQVDSDPDAPVYEGIFDGEKMITENEEFAVPANYASKSKLIPGDQLKLTIADDGRFIYKQIGPAERRRIVGTLVQEDTRYKVMAEGKMYSVLLAAVTYYKVEIGDKVTLIVPADAESDWGAIDNIVPEAGEAVALTDEEVF